jgi:hypothetical protein
VSPLFYIVSFVQVVVCNCVEELHENVEKSQLTADLGGEIPYCHQEWIQQRVVRRSKMCFRSFLLCCNKRTLLWI